VWIRRTGRGCPTRAYNTGSTQEPTVAVGHLDDQGYNAWFKDILYFVNADKVAHTLTIDPRRASPTSCTRCTSPPLRWIRARPGGQLRSRDGAFTIPPRSTVVYVTP
jgi:pullulanase